MLQDHRAKRDRRLPSSKRLLSGLERNTSTKRGDQDDLLLALPHGMVEGFIHLIFIFVVLGARRSVQLGEVGDTAGNLSIIRRVCG